MNLTQIDAWKQSLRADPPMACRPPIWARSGHSHTLIAHLLPSPSPPGSGRHQRIALPDGDHLAAVYHPGSRPVLLYLFHGLGGSTASNYMHRIMTLAASRGFHTLAVNHRGCGFGEGLAAGPYHSGRSDDLGAAVAHGRRLHPEKIHIAIGFSLSGNALLLLAAEGESPRRPDLALAVNAPIALEQAARSLKHGFSRLYDWRFLLRCRQAVRSRYKHGLIKTRYRIPLFTTLHDFDNIYTAPAGGFRDREDYYQTCSAKFKLARAGIPTILLTSKDDPMVDYRAYLAAELSPFVHLHLEDRGGHMGYLHHRPTPLGGHFWLDYAIDHFIDRSLRTLFTPNGRDEEATRWPVP